MGTSDRGVLYVVWGDVEAVLHRSMESVRACHPELPVHVHRLPSNSTVLDKAAIFNFTPFKSTVYLDADTVVLKRLDYGFDAAEHHGVACCICGCPWARRYPCFSGDAVEYNTGVLFFSLQARPLFSAWESCARQIDSSSRFQVGERAYDTPVNDQAGFSKALESMKSHPFVLPLNWNFRPRFHKTYMGPIKVWHDYEDAPPQLRAWNEDPRHDGRVIPFTVVR